MKELHYSKAILKPLANAHSNPIIFLPLPSYTLPHLYDEVIEILVYMLALPLCNCNQTIRKEGRGWLH